MLNTKFLKKTFVSLITVLSMFLSCSFINCSFAADISNSGDAEIQSIEVLTCTADKGLDNYGYVTCTVKINYNIQAKTYKVSSCTVTPHFNLVNYPLLYLIGSPTTSPASGEKVTGGYVTVYFNYGMRAPIGTKWGASCKVYL